MGMFDSFTCDGPEFVCSEGHDLSDQEFQSKDLNCDLDWYTVADGRLSGGPENRRALFGRISLACTCPLCPALIQRITHNILGTGVEFEVQIVDDVVRKVTRVSASADEQIAEAKASHWGHDAAGPMAYADAQAFRAGNPGRSLTREERKEWEASAESWDDEKYDDAGLDS